MRRVILPFILGILFFQFGQAQDGYDLCSDAIMPANVINVGAFPTTFNTIDITGAAGDPACPSHYGCFVPDGFIAFTVPSTGLYEFSIADGAVAPTGFVAWGMRATNCSWVWPGDEFWTNGSTPAPQVMVACMSLTAGQTYIMFFALDAGEGGSFDITIDNATLASNDLCTSPVALSNGVASALQDNTCATTDNIGNCGANDDNTLWYSFVMPANLENLNVSVAGGGSPIVSPMIEVYDATNGCGALVGESPFTCNGTSLDLFCLVPGTTYYIQVGSTTANTGEFTITATATDNSVANDDCSSPTINNLTACTLTTINGNNTNACPENFTGPSCPVNTDAVVWHQLNLPAGGFGFYFENLSASLQLVLYNGTTCPPAGFVQDCFTTTTYVTGLTPGNYLLSASLAGAAEGAYSFDVTALVPPSNDLCTSPLALSNGVSSAPQDNTCATTDNVGSCSNDENTLWYQFVMPANMENLNVSIAVGGSPIVNPSIEVFDATAGCGALVAEGNTCNGTTLNLFCLVPGTTYYIQISSTLVNSGDFTITATASTDGPANDECANATALAPLNQPLCNPNTFGGLTNLNACPENASLNGGGCTFSVGGAVWYTFMTGPTTTQVDIDLTPLSGTHNFAFYSGACGGLAQVACDGGSGSITNQAVGSNTTYYLLVGAVAAGQEGNFSIDITEENIPSNDLCTAPQMLTSGAPLTLQNNSCATTDNVGSCPANDENTLWYSIVMPANMENLNVTIQPTSGDPINSPMIEVYDATNGCGALVVESNPPTCNGLTHDVFCLIPGTTYYIQVGSTNANAGEFTITATATDNGVSNDVCSSPTVNNLVACTLSTISGNNTNACPENFTGPSCPVNTDAVVWHQLNLPAGGFGFYFENLSASLQLILYNGTTCPPAGFVQDCFTTDTYVTGLAPGNYLLSASLVGAAEGAYSFDVTALVPPSNDLCTSPLSLVNGAPSVLQDNTCATTDNVGNCPNDENTLWYSFVMPPNMENLNVSIAAGGSPIMNPNIEVFDATAGCGGLVSEDLICNGTSLDLFCLVPGTTYYIQVSSTLVSSGEFTVTAVASDNLVPNETCAEAIPLNLTMSLCNANMFAGETNINACPENPSLNGACTFSDGGAVWYSFTTGPMTTQLDIDLTTITGNHNFALYSGACGGLAQIACDGGSGSIMDQAVGSNTTYFLLVGAVNAGQEGMFNLDITEELVPTNDMCAGATMLTPGVPLPLQNNSCATTDNFGSCPTNDDNTLWYQFVMPANMENLNVTLAPTGGIDPLGAGSMIEVYDGTAGCGGLASVEVECNNNVLNAECLVPGTTYYIQMGSTNANAGEFTITATASDNGVPNETCAEATNLNLTMPLCNTNMFPGDNSNSCPENASLNGGGCTFNNAGAVWYQFTTGPNTVLLDVDVTPVSAATLNFAIYSGACGGLAQLACDGGSGMLVDVNVNPGTSYFLVVGSTAPLTEGTYTIDIEEKIIVANDDCNAIPPAAMLTNGNPVNGTTTCATADPNALCAPSDAHTVYYSYTTNATNYSDLTLVWGPNSATTGSPASDLSISVVTDCFGTLYPTTPNQWCGLLNGNQTMECIPPNTTVIIAVGSQDTGEGDFSIQVNELQNSVPNDQCTNPEPIVTPGPCQFVTVNGNNTGACPENFTGPSCPVETDAVIWYSITIPAGGIGLEFENLTAGVQLVVYNNGCPLPGIIQDCFTTNTQITGMGPGTYLISASLPGGAEGAFTFDVKTIVPPANDTCAPGAEVIPGSGANVTGTNNCATPAPFSYCGLNTTTSHTVYYSYTVSAPVNTDLEIRINALSGPTGVPNTGASIGVFLDCNGSPLPNMEVDGDDPCNALGVILNYECIAPGTTLIIAVGSADGNEGDFGLVITEDFSATPANDVCQNPEVIPVMDCIPLTFNGDNTNACPETFGGAPCPVDQDLVVWYSVTLPAGATGLEFDNLSAGLQLLVFDNGCPLPSFFGACITPGPNPQTVNLPGGGTYLIAASLAGAAEGPFNFDIKSIVPPVNDDPCGTVTTLNPGSNPGTTICATSDVTTAACTPHQENTVFFEYTLGPNENGFEVTVNSSGPNGIPGGATASIVVFENTACNNPVFVDESCAAVGTLAEFFCLNPNTTYVIMVATSTNNEGDFDLIFTPVPPAGMMCIDNDDCPNADVSLGTIVTDAPQVCLTDCNDYACPESFSAGGCNFNAEEVVWYQFTTDALAENLNVIATSSDFNPIIGVYLNNCAAPTEAAPGSACNVGNGSTASFNNLVIMPNTTYLIAVGPAIGDGGTFQLCVEVTTQCNDDPCTPFPLVGGVPATDCNNNTGSTQDFTYNDGSCGDPTLGESSVYFSYQVPPGLLQFQVVFTNAGANGITNNVVTTVLEYDQANCSSMQTVIANQECGDPNNLNPLFVRCPIENTVYLIQVSSAAADQGEFDIVINETFQTNPCSSNDQCSNATVLDVGDVYCEYVDFPDCNIQTCPENFFSGACNFDEIPVTWHEVTTPAGVTAMDVMVSNADFADPMLAVLIDDCFNPAAVNANTACVMATGGVAEVTDIPVTPNTTYYIIVGSPTLVTGNYTVSVSMQVPPMNDNCVNAEPLAGSVMGTTKCATQDGAFANCAGNLNESDVWYVYTPGANAQGIEITVTNWDGSSNLGVEVYGTDAGCNGLFIIDQAFDCGNSFPKTIQIGCASQYSQYYILVGSTEMGQGDFIISATDISPSCQYADNCDEITSQVLGPLMTDPNFEQFFEECTTGCLDLACPLDPPPPGDPCGFDQNPTVWFQIDVDAIAAQLFTSVVTHGTWQPVWSIYYGNDCNSLTQVQGGNQPPCSNQDATPDLHQTLVESGIQTYYIAISGQGVIDDPSFELCAYTTINAIVCLGDIGDNCNPDPSLVIEIIDREFDGPLAGPFCQGEELTVNLEFFYDATDSGADWLIGFVPDFGTGWDIQSFDFGANPPTGTPSGTATYNEYGTPCRPILQEPVPHLCTYFDQDGNLKLCNALCEACPCNLGMSPGDVLPSGYFWLQNGSNAGCVAGSCQPGQQWGIGSTQSQVNWQFTMMTKEFDSEQECLQNNDLQISFQTFSDGVAGCWEDPVGECLIDRKQFGPLWEIECDGPPRVVANPDPREICTGGVVNVTVTTEDGTSRPIIITFTDNPNVTGENNHTFPNGFGVVNDVLVNNTNSVQTVIYTAIVEDPSFICPGVPIDFEVIIYPELLVDFSPPYRLCEGESITIGPSIGGGSGVIGGYQWNTGQTSPTITVTPSSTTVYTVTVTDALGCTGSSQTTVEVSETMMLSLNQPMPVCQGATGMDPLVTIQNLFNGIGPYSFNWTPEPGLAGNPVGAGDTWQVDPDGTNPALDPTGDGFTLTLEVTDSFGCTVDASVQVFVNGPPSAFLTLQGDPPCSEDDSFTLQLVGFPGLTNLPIFQLDLYDPDDLLIAQEQIVPSVVEVPTTTIMAMGSGEFTLIVTDIGFCTAEATITVNLNEAADPVLSDMTICNGESTTLTVSNDTDYTDINWNTGDSGASINVSPNNNTTYVLTVSDATGCSKIASVDVEVNPNPVIQLGGSLSFCVGGSTTIDAGGDPMDWTYDWEDSSGTPLSGMGSSIEITAADTYFLTVTDENNCTDETSFTISESTSLSPQITGGDICDTDEVVLKAFGFDEYEWFDDMGMTIGTADTLAVNTGGMYIVSVTDLTSMCTGVDTFTVDQFNSPTAMVTDTVVACNAETGVGQTYVDFNSEVTGSTGNWFDMDLSGADLSDLDSVSFVGFSVDTLHFSYTTNTAVMPCIDTSYTMVVVVANCVCPAVDLLNPQPLCNASDTLDLNDDVKNNLNDGQWSVTAGPEPVTLLDDSVFVATGLMPGDYTIVFTLENQIGGACPPDNSVTVTVNQEVDAGMDASLDICESDAGIEDFMALLNGTPDTGGFWNDNNGTGIDPNTDPNNVDISSLSGGTYTYTYSVSAVAPCVDASATLTIHVETPPNPGSANSQDVCTLGNTIVDLDNLLGTHDEGGTWNDTDGTGVDLSDSTSVDFAAVAPGNYSFSYDLPSTAVCPADSQTVTINVAGPANAGTDGTIDMCEGESALIDLDGALGPNDNGGTWTDINLSGVDFSDPANVDFSAVPAGTYNFNYNIPAVAPCPSDAANVTVNIEAPLNPGQDSTQSVCTLSGGSVDLENMLGMHDSGGSWSDDDASGVDIVTDINNVDFTGIPAGVYNFTYTLAATAVCPEVSQTVTINVSDAANAGDDGIAAVCEGDNTGIDIFALLGNNPETGGTWSDNDATGVDLSDPGNVDFGSLGAGTYQFGYEVSAVAPCPSDQSMVEITVEAPLNPGTSSSMDVCTLGDVVDLESMLGMHDAGGSWSDDDGSGVDIVTDINNVDFTGIASGSYNFSYTLAATAVCPEVSQTVTINVSDAANAGDDGATTVCEGDNTGVDIYALLGNNPETGGTWSDNDATGVDISDPNNVDFSTVAAGTYQFGYEVSAVAPCPSDQSMVEITVEAPLNPGTSSSMDICTLGGTVDLDDLLGTHDGGGSWNDDDASGVDIVTDINNVEFAGVSPGTYNFTYTIDATAFCPAVSQTVTVNVMDAANAGTDGNMSICEGDNTGVDLFGLLGGSPESGGAWMDNDVTGVDLSDPANVNLSTLAAGTYAFGYEVTALAPCPVDLSMVEITVEAPLNPGTPGSTIICNDASGMADLEALLGGFDTGGAWSDDNTTGVDLSDVNNVSFEDITAGTYNFTYTLAATAVCPSVSETVQVEVVRAPDAGVNGGTTICEGSSTLVDLISEIDGSPDAGGAWGDMDATGVDLSDPSSVDFSALPDGSYQFSYDVPAVGPCPGDQSIVTVSLTDAPNPGTPGSGPICNDGSAINVDALLGTHDPGGNWMDLDGSGVDIAADPFDVDFMDVPAGTYDFMYTIPAAGTCPEVSEIVEVVVSDAPFAGTDNSLRICDTDTNPVDVFALIGGSPDLGGNWADLDGSGVDVNASPNSVDFSGLSAGTYDYMYTVSAVAPCVDDNAVITIEIEAPLNPGMAGSTDECDQGSTNVDIEALLGAHDSGGTWSDLDGSGVDLSDINNVDFTGVAQGPYNFMYTIPATAVCPAVSQTVLVNVSETPEAGVNGSLNICQGDGMGTDIFALIGGNPDAGGAWTDNDGSGADLSNPANVDLSGLNAGSYSYTYQVSAIAPCQDDQSTVTINIEAPLNPGMAGSTQACDEGSTNVNIDALLGTHDGGGMWSDLDGSGVDLSDVNNVDFTGVAQGTYDFIYTIPATAVCPAVSQTVQVTVNETPDAGADGSLDLCEGDGAGTNIFALIGGNPDTGGNWTDNDGSGVDLSNPANVDLSTLTGGSYSYSYDVSAIAPCVADQSIVTINIESPLNPGMAGSSDICNSVTTVTDVESLLGVHDGGGTWSDNNGSGVDLSNPSNVDFDGITAGLYNFTYTIAATAICPAVSQTVQVNVNQIPVAGVPDVPYRLCLGEDEMVNLADLLSGEDPGGQWVETSSNPSTGGAFDANAGTFTTGVQTAGSYSFEYNLDGGVACPDASETVEVIIEALPLADAGEDQTLTCDIEVVEIGGTGSSSGADISYQWFDENNNPISGATSETLPGVTVEGDYTLMVTDNSTGCFETDEITVILDDEAPTMNLVGEPPSCFGDQNGIINAVNVIGGDGVYEFSIDGGQTWQSSVQFNNLAAGTWVIQVRDGKGCIFEESLVLPQRDLMTADVLVDGDIEVVSYGESVTLTAITNVIDAEIADIEWSANDTIVCQGVNCVTISHEPYPGTTQYEVLITDVNGCQAIATVQVRAEIIKEIYVPNIFSPNANEPDNQWFFPSGPPSLERILEMRVYDRWGELVYLGTDFDPNIPDQGWNGEFKGEPVNPGVFVYYIEAKFIFDDETVKVSGDVTIIR